MSLNGFECLDKSEFVVRLSRFPDINLVLLIMCSVLTFSLENRREGVIL